jgi:hypothetical protein
LKKRSLLHHACSQMLKLMTIIIQTELITLRFLSHEPLWGSEEGFQQLFFSCWTGRRPWSSGTLFMDVLNSSSCFRLISDASNVASRCWISLKPPCKLSLHFSDVLVLPVTLPQSLAVLPPLFQVTYTEKNIKILVSYGQSKSEYIFFGTPCTLVD